MSSDNIKWDAELYQKSSQFQFNLGLMAIERLNPNNKENILEIGSGNAMLTIELAKKIPNGSITGIELSEEQFAQAQDNLKNYSISNVNIVQMDALSIDYEHKFDAVFSNSAIHWINDLESMYKKIFAALKSGGRIMIQTGLKEINELFRVIFELVKHEEFKENLKAFKNPWRFYSVRENQKLLEKCGFQEINVEPYHYTMKFECEEELMNYCRAAAFVPLFALIPKEKHDRFLTVAKETWLKTNSEDPLKISMNRVFLSAKK